jgi:hypothetical protein
MYYEGWWGGWYNRLPYLVPCALCLALMILALTWPRLGGWIILVSGSTFTAWRWIRQAEIGMLTWNWMLGWLPATGVLVVAGLLFLLEGRHRRQRRERGWQAPEGWLRRNRRLLIALAPPVLAAVALSAHFAPILLDRYDSGDRTAQRIEAGDVTLIWAPAGPGWNWRPWDEEGRWLSWDDLAVYGMEPLGIQRTPKLKRLGRHATEAEMASTGLCRYLNAAGTLLMAEPQGIWRMPTAHEVVRSLVRQDRTAGCRWDGVSSKAVCARQPNKETPLWAPDEAPIYYWTAEECDGGAAWYVPYTGGIQYGGSIGCQPKAWGNSRHGFRCVRGTLDQVPAAED